MKLSRKLINFVKRRRAYGCARTKVLLEKKKAEGLNISLIQSKLKDIKVNLDTFRQVRTKCTNAERALENIRALLGKIQDCIAKELSDINEEIVRITAK